MISSFTDLWLNLYLHTSLAQRVIKMRIDLETDLTIRQYSTEDIHSMSFLTTNPLKTSNTKP